MSERMPSWLKRISLIPVVFGLFYALAILALTNPVIQRNVTYAHNVNPTSWQNLSNVEQFGFLHHQIQPFTVKSTDNVTIFAWHILPLSVYRQHESDLIANHNQDIKPYVLASEEGGLKILHENPKAHVIVSFHGNAAHLASSYRPSTYQQFLSTSTSDRPVHVIAFDYRGFGLSTGSPTEQGVIQDAVSLLSAITGHSSSNSLQVQNNVESDSEPRGVHPSRIILVGQSLGTFISTALYHEWTIVQNLPAFKGLVLIASFTSLKKLLDSYSIKGIIPPLLSPLNGIPGLREWFLTSLVDKWDTQRRLLDLFRRDDIPLNLAIMHARDDWEIPWKEGRGNWDAILSTVNVSHQNGSDIDYESWHGQSSRKVARWNLLQHGGHNRIPVSEQTKLAILKILDSN